MTRPRPPWANDVDTEAPARPALPDPLSVAALALYGLAAALLAWPLARLPLRLAVAYNEGWNAYHASHWRDAAALYPEPTALFTNNYPPLSFVLMGVLGDLAGDHLIVGRAVALASLVWTCIVVALLVRRAGGPAAAAACAGAWLFAAVAIYAPGYAAINDPQWLGHALMMSGLVLLTDERRGRIGLAAGLMVLAGLVKHTLLPLPLAVALVLLVTDRSSALRFMGWGVGLAAIGLASCLAAYGPGMVWGILGSEASRAMSLANLGVFGSRIVPPMLPVLALTMWQGWRDGGPAASVAAVYAILALAFGLFIGQGYGVAASAFLDLIIACALGSGLALVQAGASRPLQSLALGLMVLALVPGLPGRARQHAQAFATLGQDRADAAAATALLAARPAPVLCEALALCYWAGQPATVDFFNTGQKMLAGLIPSEALSVPLRQEAFGAIQLEPRLGGAMPSRQEGMGDNRLPLSVAEAWSEAYATEATFGRAGRVLTP